MGVLVLGSVVYRPRRPAATVLHKTVRNNLESYLSACRQDGPWLLSL